MNSHSFGALPGVIAPIEAFTIQWHDGNQWEDTEIDVKSNTSPGWAATFPPIQTRQVRVVVNKTKENISRIWEIEFYQPIKE